MLKSVLGAALFTLCTATSLVAQDLGGQWIDRVTSELRAEKAPPKEGSQFTYNAQAGLLYAFDNNIFLTETNRTSDSILIPYAQASIGYVEPQFEASASLLIDYKDYIKTDHLNDWEQRFLGKIGYAGSEFGASLIQLLRNESDPIDAVFAQRVERFISDTIPRFYVDITNILAVEFEGYVQVVRFNNKTLGDARDNENYRLALALVYKSEFSLDFLVQGGAIFIHYDGGKDALGNPTEPPNDRGWFVRAGVRGDVMPDFYLEALLGVTKIQSGDFQFATLPPRNGESHTTMDASIFARYKAIDRLVLSSGYTRQFGFAGGTDPFQVVNRFSALAEFQAMEQLTIRFRVQYDYVQGSTSFNRTYGSIGALATYKVMEHVVLDGGLTGRFGRVSGNVANVTDYQDLVFQVGIGVAW